MSTSTRENMRRELKELAKLAETMGKEPRPAEPSESAAALASPGLQRPATPASSSRVTVPPVAFPSTPPPFASPFSSEPPPRKGNRFMALAIGGSLAVALVGGAVVGKSLAGRSTTATVPAEVRAAAVAAPAEPAPVVAEPQAVVQPPEPAAVTPPPAALVTPKGAGAASPATAASSAVHKHWPKAAGTPAPLAAKPAVAGATPAAPAAAGNDAAPVAAAKPAAAPPAAKAGAAKPAAGGGTDSLEDLIRKEVAAGKK